MSVTKLVIVATHPIQYQIPWYQKLAQEPSIELTVLYGFLPNAAQQSVGFGKEFVWDIPLFDGYTHRVLDNRAKNPSASQFSGIDCPSVGQALHELDADVVIITGWQSKFLLQALWAAKRKRIPTIVRGDSNDFRSRPAHVRLIHRLFLRCFDAFLAVGKSNTNFYLGNGVSAQKIFQCPYFVENERFITSATLSTQSKRELRASLGIEETALCFVYSGKLVPVKNLVEMLAAFKILCDKVQGVHLILIGDGEQMDRLKAFSNQHQLPVSFLGFVNQSMIPKMYAIGDCLLLASDYEAWGLAVNEAMVCGLPAIVSNRVGCGPDLIIEGKTGYIYTFGNTQELADKMALVDLTSAREMGAAAKQHVLTHYAVTHSVDSTMAAIKAVTKP